MRVGLTVVSGRGQTFAVGISRVLVRRHRFSRVIWNGSADAVAHCGSLE